MNSLQTFIYQDISQEWLGSNFSWKIEFGNARSTFLWGEKLASAPLSLYGACILQFINNPSAPYDFTASET